MSARCACRHQMIVLEGENVCAKCGAVDGVPEDGGSMYDQSPVPNLFLARSLGTGEEIPRGAGNAAVRRFFRGGLTDQTQRNLSRFSNVCQKLGLYQHARQDAWRTFALLCRKMPQKTAEHASLSIYFTCRRSGIPVSEDEIIASVGSAFGRKSLPSMAKIIYRHMNLMEYGGPDGSGDKYYFNVALRERIAGLKMSEAGLARCKRLAWFLFTEIYTAGNARRRAKLSVDGAFGGTSR